MNYAFILFLSLIAAIVLLDIVAIVILHRASDAKKVDKRVKFIHLISSFIGTVFLAAFLLVVYRIAPLIFPAFFD